MPTLAQVIDELKQFKRTCSLSIARTTTPANGDDYFVRKDGSSGIVVTDMRVKFRVERSSKAKHNKCDVEVYNLADETRAAMETRPLAVELLAGHQGINRLVLTGDVIFAMSKLESPDWVTMLQVGDGARSLSRARINVSYNRGTTVKQLLREVCKSMGQRLPANIEALQDLDFQLGTSGVLHGSAREELETVLAPYNVDCSFQNGTLQILRRNESRSDVHVVNEKNGMIGSPEFGQPRGNNKPPTMSVKMLLRPEILPGSLIDLKSEHKSGRFKVSKVTHEGDTHDPVWFTDVEIQP